MGKKSSYSWVDLDGNPINSHKDLHPNTTHLVYIIYYADGSKYIGKVATVKTLTKPAPKKLKTNVRYFNKEVLRDEQHNIITSKSAKKAARARGLKAKREKYYTVTIERDFLRYKGSRDYSLDEVEKVVDYIQVIYETTTEVAATYLEAHLQFGQQVLFDDTYLNKNILGKFYDNVLDGAVYNN